MFKALNDLDINVKYLLQANERYRTGDQRPVFFPVGARKDDHSTAGAQERDEKAIGAGRDQHADLTVPTCSPSPTLNWLFQYQQSQAFCVPNGFMIATFLSCGHVPPSLEATLRTEPFRACKVGEVIRVMDGFIDPILHTNPLPFVVRRVKFPGFSALLTSIRDANAPYSQDKNDAMWFPVRISDAAALERFQSLGGVAVVQHSLHVTCWDLNSGLLYETDPDFPVSMSLTWETLTNYDLLPITDVYRLIPRAEPESVHHRTKRQRMRQSRTRLAALSK